MGWGSSDSRREPAQVDGVRPFELRSDWDCPHSVCRLEYRKAVDVQNSQGEPEVGDLSLDLTETLFESGALDDHSATGTPSGALTLDGVLDRHKPRQVVLDGFDEFVRLSLAELRVLDHPAMMRLRRVKQLGLTDYVFPTATHVRREHAIGTLHIAHLILVHLQENIEMARHDAPTGQFPPDMRSLSLAETALTRLAALLHDVGHLPSGHTFEDELGLLDKHDHPQRLELVLAREPADWDVLDRPESLISDLDGERLIAASAPVDPTRVTLRELIDREYADVAEESGLGLAPSEILVLLVAGDDATKARAQDADARSATAAEQGGPLFRIGVCRDIVGNTICADLIDYLRRDWMHLGRPSQIDRRLLQYMQIRRRPQEPSALAVDLRSKDDVRTDAISSILRLLDSRYELFEMALYHRTKLNASTMLERAIAEIADGYSDQGSEWLSALPERLLDLSDDELFGFLVRTARSLPTRRSPKLRIKMAHVEQLLVALRQRRLHRRVASWTYNELHQDTRKKIQEMYSHRRGVEGTRGGSPANNRLRALRLLEGDFGLAPLSLGMYCPPREMSDKIARVRVRVGEQMAELQFLEDESDGPGLTGGRLGAQSSRFHQLWRVHFSCAPDALGELERRKLRGPFLEALDLLVLNLDSSTRVPVDDRIAGLVQNLAAAPNSPFEGRRMLEPSRVLAQKGEALEVYPTGYPTLDSFFETK